MDRAARTVLSIAVKCDGAKGKGRWHSPDVEPQSWIAMREP
jgi:hypothetical protein